ncbi:MAG TPA: glycoside hydrolase family 11 protein [Clostridia bacterium]
MIKKMKVIVAGLLTVTSLFASCAFNAQAATTITSDTTGFQGDWFYSFWNQGGGSVSMTLGDDGNYSAKWSNCSNFTCGKGWKPGSDRDVSYSGTFDGGNNGYLALYGWTKDPLIEYYVVENYGSWTPPGGTSLGTMTSDGGTYNIYKTRRENQPSIIGTASFDQYWSVRTSKRSSGTVTFKNHINAWASKGMKMGTTWDYQIMETEGYQSSGSSNITVVGKPDSPTPTPTTPTSTPISGITYGDVNGDGKINSTDLSLMKRYILETGDLTVKAAGDLNGDGKVNSTDASILKRYILGQVTSLPIGGTQTPTPTPTPTPVPVTPTPNPNAKLCALTFDDGPDVTLTPKVLDKLDKYQVPGTFMMIGQKVNDSTASVIKRIIDSGYEIGNHSWAYDSMSSMSADQIKKSISDTNAAILKYSGTTPKFFRAPNLSYSSTMYSAIDLTFVQGVTCNDWTQSTTAQERANAIIQGAKDGAIFLMHDVQPLPHPTPEALDIIIPTLKNQGYEFVTLSELFKRKGVKLDPNDSIAHTYLPN